MTRTCWLLSLLFLAVVASPAQAVFERDWQTPGDGLLTYDDVNQREWLDLSETLLEQYSGSLLTRFQAVITETAPGGDFAGFVAATEADVIGLAESAGIDTGTVSLAVNGTAATELIDLLGPTLGSTASLAYLENFPESARIAISVGTNKAGFLSGLITLDPGGIPSVTGVWLYRQIPEPTMVLLLLQGTTAILLLRRRLPSRQ